MTAACTRRRDLSYFLLFINAFGAATLLPLSSEVVLLALLASGYAPGLLWLSASTGNTLGSAVNWAMGRYLTHFEQKRWFPISADKLHRGQRWFQRYGVWSLLLAWLPVVGDALTLAAGVLRVKFWLFCLFIAIGKGARYGVIVALYFGMFE